MRAAIKVSTLLESYRQEDDRTIAKKPLQKYRIGTDNYWRGGDGA